MLEITKDGQYIMHGEVYLNREPVLAGSKGLGSGDIRLGDGGGAAGGCSCNLTPIYNKLDEHDKKIKELEKKVNEILNKLGALESIVISGLRNLADDQQQLLMYIQDLQLQVSKKENIEI